MSIRKDIQSLDPGSLIELFELDASNLGGPVAYFHAGTNEIYSPIVWQGKTYNAWPIEAEGFEFNGRGQLPTPKMRVANIAGAITALAIAFDDLIGAKITRRRTFAKYLDGRPTADPSAEFADDIFFVERKVSETRAIIEYELSSSMDVQGILLPLRQVVTNFCQWRYRSAECTYSGGAVADINDVPTGVLASDNCSRRLTGCALRFGDNGPLPFGAQPATQIL